MAQPRLPDLATRVQGLAVAPDRHRWVSTSLANLLGGAPPNALCRQPFPASVVNTDARKPWTFGDRGGSDRRRLSSLRNARRGSSQIRKSPRSRGSFGVGNGTCPAPHLGSFSDVSHPARVFGTISRLYAVSPRRMRLGLSDRRARAQAGATKRDFMLTHEHSCDWEKSKGAASSCRTASERR